MSVSGITATGTPKGASTDPVASGAAYTLSVDGVVTRRAADVRREPVSWLWADRVPFGAITVLAGAPGLGKSLLTVHLVSQLTRGLIGDGQSNAVMLTAEDPLAQIVRPRLEAADADIHRVVLPAVMRDGIETVFVLPDDMNGVRTVVLAERAGLLVVDPLSAHLAASVNSWKDQNVRQALAPLHALAEESGAAVVVVAHLNKSQSADPLQRLGGSIGLAAAARSVLLLARDPDDPDGEVGNGRVLAHVKSNIGPLAPSVKLLIEPVKVDDETGAARVLEAGESPYSASELLAVEPAEHGAKLAVAIGLLEEELRDEPRPVRELSEAAASLGLSEQTLRRAKKALGVETKKLDYDRGWGWYLPAPADDQAA